MLYQLSCSGTPANRSALAEDLAAALVLDDLPLHALERVVDRLRVAAELLDADPVGAAAALAGVR